MPEEPRPFLERLGSLWDDPFITDGFIAGVIAGFILVVIVCAIVYWIGRRHRCRGIPVQGEDGDLFITVNAMREFVVLVLGEFSQASLASVALLERGDSLVLNIALNVRPDTDVVPLVELLRQRIMTGAREKMGIEKPLKVNVSIGSLSAKERKGLRSQRPMGRRADSPLADEAPTDGATEGPTIPTARGPVPLE